MILLNAVGQASLFTFIIPLGRNCAATAAESTSFHKCTWWLYKKNNAEEASFSAKPKGKDSGLTKHSISKPFSFSETKNCGVKVSDPNSIFSRWEVLKLFPFGKK